MNTLLSDEAIQRLHSGIRAGRYSLLLGAGFSLAAHSHDGRPLPSAQELVDELADAFGLPRGYQLPRLWNALPTPEREEYLQRRFLNCIVPPGSLPLNQFVWRCIWSLNVDDVVETIYRSRSQQELLPRYPNSRYVPRETLNEVHLVHLHGCVLSPESGYVFSTEEYGRTTARPSVWGQILADALAIQPFVVIGSSLDEYDIEHYLALRAGLDTSREPYPSLLITPKLDAVIEATARRYGLLPVAATASSFLSWLTGSIGEVPSPSELLLPIAPAELYAQTPKQSSFRIFHRQFLYVSPKELPQPLHPRNFLTGTEPTWHDIVERHDIMREDVRNLLDAAEDGRNGSSGQPRLVLLTSLPGGGRSTVLMRAAFELASNAIPVFFFHGRERLAVEAAADCIGSLRKAPVLFFDGATEHSDQMFELVEILNARRTDCAVVTAERIGELRRMRLSLREGHPRSIELSRLSAGEALDLIGRLRAEGLLGRNAALPDQELAKRVQKKHLLVAMCEATGTGERFDDLIKSMWSKVPEGEMRLVLATVALAHGFGYPVRFAVAERCGGSDAGKIAREIGAGSLSGLLFREGYAGEYLRIIHRIIAERIVRIVPPDLLFTAYVTLARSLAKYVNIRTLKSRSLEVRLAGRLLDYDRAVKPNLNEKSRDFYQRIKTEWEWNSRYWEQVALLELNSGDYGKSISNAEHAVGLEPHAFAYTTLGHVLLAAAAEAGDATRAVEHFADGIAALKEGIQRSQRWRFFGLHPHHSAIVGAVKYAERWGYGAIDFETALWVTVLLEEAINNYPRQFNWSDLSKRWTALAGGTGR